jgi:hypothetical protein
VLNLRCVNDAHPRSWIEKFTHHSPTQTANTLSVWVTSE